MQPSLPSPQRPLEQKIAASWPVERWREVTVLLAVSGGADSVALVRALQVLKTSGAGTLIVGHFNHRLRGEQSQADQRFVESLCKTLRLELVVGQAKFTPEPGGGGFSEEAFRAARYDFLLDVAQRRGARYVVTAHTSDDQAETILHRIVRGTGLAGLAGMRRTRPLTGAIALVRPMLQTTRAEVLEYLASLDQSFRVDETNRDLKFIRNRIRHELLPLLERDYSPSVVESLLRLGQLAADAQRVIDGLTESLLARSVLAADARRVSLDCGKLAGQDPHLVRAMFVALWQQQGWPRQAMGFAQWNLLAEMALNRGADARKQVLPGAISAHKRREQLLLEAWEATVILAPETQA